MIGETKYETKYDWWLSRPGVGGGCWGKWGDCKWVRERYIMAADVVKRSMFEIIFPRRYNIYFLNNNVVTEFQCYSEV